MRVEGVAGEHGMDRGGGGSHAAYVSPLSPVSNHSFATASDHTCSLPKGHSLCKPLFPVCKLVVQRYRGRYLMQFLSVLPHTRGVLHLIQDHVGNTWARCPMINPTIPMAKTLTKTIGKRASRSLCVAANSKNTKHTWCLVPGTSYYMVAS